MAQRHRPAIGVHLRRIEAQLLRHGQRLCRKGLVRLDHVEIADRQAGALHQRLDRRNRTDAHHLGPHARMGIADDPRARAQARLFRRRGPRQNQRRRPVIDARGIARRHGPVLLEHRLQPRQRLKARGLRMLVGVEHDRSLARGDLHRDDLIPEPPLGDGLGRTGLAFHREGILRRAGDAVFLGDILRRHAHMAGAEGAAQRAGHHVERPRIPHLLPEARGLKDIGRTAHAFGPARQREIGIPQHQRLRRRHDGLRARSAKTVDVHRGRPVRDTRLDRRHPA